MALNTAKLRQARERVRRLPRDARDTLFLLCVIGWTILPHVPNIPAWCSALAALLLGWRGVLALRGEPLPSRVWLVMLLAVASLLTWSSHNTLIGKEAGVTMAVVLMALKTLELRARRDAFVVFFLGFFLVLTHFFYSQSIVTALMMLVSVWGLMTALVLAHMPAGRPALLRAGGQAMRAALAGAPLMALLFVLFPRIGPLWGSPQEAIGKTGLSGTMELGAMAEIANDDSIAFRVRFADGSAPPPAAMYFRGPVLTSFDGREWRMLPPRFAPAQPAGTPPARRLGYEMTLEPSRLAMLPLLEATLDAPAIEADGEPPRARLRSDLTWTLDRPLYERTRVTAVAQPTARHGPTRMNVDLQDALELPPGHNPRTLQWAAKMHADPRFVLADADQLAAAVLQHIRDGGFSYTLSPGTYGDGDPKGIVDEFWLDRKAGFCEHFAASFVVVMRALGVPARVVTGYQGADPLVIDGYHVVRQSSAHAWAEYWVAGLGWQRADPTSAVAPDRIQASRYLQPQRGIVGGAIDTFVNRTLLTQLRANWDALNNRWNQWVLNYSRGQQLQALRGLGWREPSWEDLALMLLIALTGLALAGAVWAWVDHRRQDPWARLLGNVRRALRRAGVDAPAHAGPRQLAKAVLARPHGADMAGWLLALDAARYGRDARRRPRRGAWREFVRLQRALKGS